MAARLIARLLIGLSVVVLGIDLLLTLEMGGLRVLSLAETWALLSKASFAHVLGPEASPDALDGVAGFFLGLPAFSPFLILGLVLLYANPKRPKGIFRS
ncbi:MAG: hypothetical protein ACOY99_13225 [Pseudomonadota bacterium]|jgi:hypothetical protein